MGFSDATTTHGNSSRTRSLLFSLLLIICFAALPPPTWCSPSSFSPFPPPARRCSLGWNNESVTLLDDLTQSTCQSCNPAQHDQRHPSSIVVSQTTTTTTTVSAYESSTSHRINTTDGKGDDCDSFTNESSNNYDDTALPEHVGVLIPHVFSEPYLIMSSILLLKGHRVTVFLHQQYTTPMAFDDIREFILRHIPCDAQLCTSNRLRIEYMVMNNSPCYDLIMVHRSARLMCAIKEAAADDLFLIMRHRSVLQVRPVDVLVLDAGKVAGQLAATSLGIPVVAILDPFFYDDLLIRRWVHLRRQTLLARAVQKIIDFWEEIEWTAFFAKYNRICRRLGLPAITTIGEIWDSVTLVLTKRYETKSNHVLFMDGPLMPPCSPCQDPSPIADFSHYDSRVLVRFHGDAKLNRDMLRAFWMARESLTQWALSCKSTNTCPDNVTEWADFGVARIGPSLEKFLPHFLAAFAPDTPMLSALGYMLSNHERILLIVVDSWELQENSWLNQLGIPILTVDRGLSIRELAKEILRGIHRKRDDPSNRLVSAKGARALLDAVQIKDPWSKYGHRRNENIGEDNPTGLLLWWFGSCFLISFLITLLEFYTEGETSWESCGEIVWKHLEWHELEAIGLEWQSWARREWSGTDAHSTSATHRSTTSSSISSPAPHRRRKPHKKKQA